jgi:hypothetical protein
MEVNLRRVGRGISFGCNSAIISNLAQSTMNIQGLYRFVLKLKDRKGHAMFLQC